MNPLHWLARPSWVALLPVCALPFVLSSILNRGFIASDEYWTGMTRYIPAQKASLSTLLVEDDVKSPTQLMPMHFFAQTALALGIEHPFQQYAFVVLCLGLLSTLSLFMVFRFFHEDDFARRLSVFCLAFYFAAPSVLTRPMFEALAAPFVAASAPFAIRYDRRGVLSNLLWGSFFGAVAFCLRPQTGVCCVIFPILALVHRRWRDFFGIAFWGGWLFFLTGLPDLWLRGSWHHSLKGLISYNVEHGAEYGHEPWFYYLPIVFLLCFGPWMIVNYGRGWVLDYYRRFRSAWWMVGIFLLEHSLFTHKFERFLIPLMPLLILLIVPPLLFFIEDFPRRKWRLGSLAVFNLVLWLPATFSEPQGHLIRMVQYFELHREIRSVLSVDEALTWIPDVFSARDPVGITDLQLTEVGPGRISCQDWLVVREPLVEEVRKKDPRFETVEVFRSGLIEQGAYWLNPEHNLRRAPVVLMGCASREMKN